MSATILCVDAGLFKDLEQLANKPCAFGMAAIAFDVCKHTYADRQLGSLGVAALAFALGHICDAGCHRLRAYISGRKPPKK